MPVREGSCPARPSSRPTHTQTAAKLPGFSQTAQGFTAETDSPLEQGGFKLPVPARTAVDCRPISLDSSSTKTTSGVRASRTRFGQLADQRVALRYR